MTHPDIDTRDAQGIAGKTDPSARGRLQDFQGKTAIITGAASGIGLALAGHCR